MAEDEFEDGEETPGLLKWAAGALARRSGAVLVDGPQYDLMEAEVKDRRVLRKELDLIAYTALDYVGGSEQDMQAVARRNLVQQARVAWQRDPQLGGSVDLMNDFTLGRGVPRPRAADPKVQEVLDEAWEDPDNQRVLTSYAAQMALGTDLSLQSNVFILVFDDGNDGKVKLSLLDHDAVEDVVRDPENRHKILYYKVRQRRIKYDFQSDMAKVDPTLESRDRFRYHAHWENEPSSGEDTCPEKKLGKGRVYHVAINRTSEAAFGHPTMHRTLRWATAFNSMMEAQVDAAKAAAAFMMKRKVKGSPNQVRKAAQQALSRSSELGRYRDPEDPEMLVGPKGGSTITENEGIEHESFKLDSGAQSAHLNSQMIRAQISAGTHFPQHYLGDVGSANLATANSMELPVLKTVESRQEVLEQLYRWFIDHVIEQAVAKQTLSKTLSDEEWEKLQADRDQEGQSGQPEATAPTDGATAPALTTELGIPDPEEENERERDLSYDFGLPSPLRRMMSDLVTAISTVARTFDPNGTNIELTRELFNIVLGEGLEVADPAKTTDKIFPPGYVDPAMEAMQQAQGGAPGAGGAPPPGIQFVPNEGDAPPGAAQPEQNPYAMAEARLRTRDEALRDLQESHIAARMPSEMREQLAHEQARRDNEMRGAVEQLVSTLGSS